MRAYTLRWVKRGQHVSWTPRLCEGWGYGDASCNEFVVADEKGIDELSEELFDAYMEWSEQRQHAVVDRVLHGEVLLRLDLDSVLRGPAVLSYVLYQDDHVGNWDVTEGRYRDQFYVTMLPTSRFTRECAYGPFTSYEEAAAHARTLSSDPNEGIVVGVRQP